MHLNRRAWLLGIFLAACATTSGAGRGSDDPPLAPNEVRVRLWASTAADPTPRRIESGSTLQSGDKFRIELQAAKPAYVYAFKTAAPGAAVQFYPPAGRSTGAALALMMPADDDYYTLGETAGGEDLRIIAALHELSDEQQAAAAAAASFTDKSQATREPPPVLTEDKRTPFWVRVRLDDQGVARARFLIRHR